MHRLIALLIAAAIGLGAAGSPPPAAAQSGAEVRAEAERLFDVLRLDEVIAQMRTEGLDYADDLHADLFAGRVTAAWRDAVSHIYDTGAMEAAVRRDFLAAIGDTDTAGLAAFFAGQPGARILQLELDARRALADEEIEAAAKARAGRMSAAGDPMMDRIEAFISANDLVERNVAGAMNASLAFATALGDSAPGTPMADRDVLSEVWAQEPEIREDTESWVRGFLTVAYGPLRPGELDDYIALSRTPEGRALNTALFAAFDALYIDISARLGDTAGRFLQSEEI